MVQDPFPGREPDGPRPRGSEPENDGPRPARGSGLDSAGEQTEDGLEGPEQGLFVCLAAEDLDVVGFAQDGRADTMVPGPLLATVVDALTGEDGAGLVALSDDQLVGIISAARRMESRSAWTQLAATREFARRHPARDRAGQDIAGVSEFAADELAAEFHLSWQASMDQMAYACTAAEWLPRAFAALAAGRIHPVHLRIIEDETRILSPQDAAAADEILAEAAPSKTFGELRYAAHRLVLKLDPDAARRRKEAARREAHVRRFREDSGNAGMIARELPSDEILASWQHVEQRALDLRAAGVPGTLRELRIRAFLDLLQERDSRDAVGDPDLDQGDVDGQDRSSEPGPRHGSTAGRGPGDNDDAVGDRDPDVPDIQGGPGRDLGGPAGTGGGDSARPGGQDSGPSLAALVNITVPWSTLVGESETPGEAAGFGLVDAGTARDLMAAAARHRQTRWCVTALLPDGTAAAHGCVPGRDLPPAPDGHAPRGLKIRFYPVIRGPCDHCQAEDAYRPSRSLRHLVRVRNARCTAPGCSRPAARCDLDHTTPWHNDGLTCPCNLAPLCRHHHRGKQAEGWRLEQPRPGVLVWRTPSGRAYTTTPTAYPV